MLDEAREEARRAGETERLPRRARSTPSRPGATSSNPTSITSSSSSSPSAAGVRDAATELHRDHRPCARRPRRRPPPAAVGLRRRVAGRVESPDVDVGGSRPTISPRSPTIDAGRGRRRRERDPPNVGPDRVDDRAVDRRRRSTTTIRTVLESTTRSTIRRRSEPDSIGSTTCRPPTTADADDFRFTFDDERPAPADDSPDAASNRHRRPRPAR